MAERKMMIKQNHAQRMFKAARAAGFSRAHLIEHPDGRIEIIAEDVDQAPHVDARSPFEQWKADHAS